MLRNLDSFTKVQPWRVSFLLSLGSRVDPWQWGVLPVHTHLHGFEHTAHAGAAEGARGVPDHCEGTFGAAAHTCSVAARRLRTQNGTLWPDKAVLKSIPLRITSRTWRNWATQMDRDTSSLWRFLLPVTSAPPFPLHWSRFCSSEFFRYFPSPPPLFFSSSFVLFVILLLFLSVF